MIRKIITFLLSLLTVGFAMLTYHRSTMTYNENGVFFDGETTYDTDAVVAYGIITALLLLVTILFWKAKLRAGNSHSIK